MTLYEKGDRLARLVLTEHGFEGRGPRFTIEELLPTGPKRSTVDEAEMMTWRKLSPEKIEEAMRLAVGPSSCLRCRRLNLGPCISATCVDRQAPYSVITGVVA